MQGYFLYVAGILLVAGILFVAGFFTEDLLADFFLETDPPPPPELTTKAEAEAEAEAGDGVGFFKNPSSATLATRKPR